jgi:hypothetical protein
MFLFLMGASIVCALLLASPAYATDLMIANMDNGRGEHTVHTQASNDCVKALRIFRGLQKRGEKMQLTFVEPPYGGYVLELHCVRPDGSIVGN